jgi:inorganic pyrophosphatase
MTPINELSARISDAGLINVVVETPRGSRIKYKYDEERVAEAGQVPAQSARDSTPAVARADGRAG